MPFLHASFCHIFRYRAKSSPKTHTHSLKSANFFSRHAFYLLWPGPRPKANPFCVRQFATFRDTELNLGQTTFLQHQKHQMFSRAPKPRARGLYLYFFGWESGQKQDFSCVSFYHISQCRAKFMPKKILAASKTQKISRARLWRALAACIFIFFGRGRGAVKHEPFCVCVILPHFAMQS